MSLRTFCLRIFQHCPLLASFSAENHIQAFEEFLQYKTRVPVRGAILLNHEMDSAVLVKGWKKGANWSFPRGKINKDEDDLDCAIREVWEETGLDLRAAGLVPEGKVKYIEITMREQQMRLYVFRDVPMNTHFQPQTRKEISKIEWYKLSELPSFRKKGGQNGNQDGASNANKFYMVAPFLVPLKKWIVAQKKLEAKRLPSANTLMPNPHYSLDEVPTEDDTWSHAPPVAQPLPPQIAQPGDVSIEGATNELQRLLKLQPAAPGVASYSTQEDKASALLSMLKSKDLAAQPQMKPNAQLPHTPLGLTTEQPPQPRNPHHHTNQHPSHIHTNEPPPQFSIHQHQPNMQWQAAPHGSYQVEPQGGHQAPLVHPQPLPPQVQRAMFNQSTFQENLASSEAAQRQQPQDYAPPMPSLQASNIPAPQSLQLNGKSLALLNAFKKSPPKGAAVQPVPHQEYVHQGDAASDYPAYKPHSGAQDSAPVSELAGWMKAQPPVNQNRMQPAPDTHRSSLLDMFRGDQPQATAPKEAPKPVNQPPTILSRPQGGAGVGGSMEKQLLDTLRRAPLTSDPQANFPPKASYGATDTSAALSDFLALRPRSNQTADQPAIPRSTASSGVAQSPQPHHQQQATQPIRILQRGNPVDGQGYTSPAQRSSYSNRPPNSLGYASPSNVPSVPSPGTSARRPEASQDQKRQLLSLFSKKQQQQQQQQAPSAVQQGGQASSSIELAAGEVSRSRLASFASGSGEGSFSAQGPPSRGGTQTPISPADQTFLLDYLQSVTNNASR